MYPAPVITAWEMSTVAVPLLVTVRLCVVLLPTATFPKLRLDALGERTPEFGSPGFPPCDAPALAYPAQLDRPTIVKNSAIVRRIASGWAFGDSIRPHEREAKVRG